MISWRRGERSPIPRKTVSRLKNGLPSSDARREKLLRLLPAASFVYTQKTQSSSSSRGMESTFLSPFILLLNCWSVTDPFRQTALGDILPCLRSFDRREAFILFSLSSTFSLSSGNFAYTVSAADVAARKFHSFRNSALSRSCSFLEWIQRKLVSKTFVSAPVKKDPCISTAEREREREL